MELSEKQKEILLITQEECSEVSQVISKIFRFGIDNTWNDISNRNRFGEELGDLLCMIHLIIESGLIDERDLFCCAAKKKEKLKKWSNIF